jgi:tetratricopeptide (TPR) repeat protein
LAERFPETAETQPEVLAQHYNEAGLHEQALLYWQRAGQLAIEHSAYREAVGCFEQALSALPHLPETRDTREQAIDLRLALRTALLPSGDQGRILTCLREAESLAEALDDSRRLAQVSIFLIVHFIHRGAYAQAIAVAQRTLALATASDDVVLQALANLYLGSTYIVQGNYRQALGCLRQTMATLDGARRRELFGQVSPPAVQCYGMLAWCHAELGTFAEGSAFGAEGLQIAEMTAHPASFTWAYCGIGLLALRQGDVPRALSSLERAMGSWQGVDRPGIFPAVAAALGATYTLGGRVADAVSLLTQEIERTIAMGRVHFEALCRLPLGEAQMLAGRLEEAQALAERTLAHTHAYQERSNQAYVLRLLGDIAARREPPAVEVAQSHYQHALALAAELGMRPLQAHCHHSLGTLYRQTGCDELARAALSTAIEMYRAMDMTFWLPAAEGALAQVQRS